MRIALIAVDQRETLRQYDRSDPSFHRAVDALLQGLAERDDTEAHVVSCLQRRMRPAEQLAHSVHSHSVYVPKTGWLRSGYLGCVRGIRRKLREIQPDIVHGHGTERYAALCAARSGYPSIVTIHGNMRRVALALDAPIFSFNWLAAMLERFTLPRAGGTICPSQYAKDQISELNARTWLIPNAVPQVFFDLQRNVEPGLILVVGDILPYKNQTGFIRAMDSLAQDTTFRTVFVGRSFPSSSYTREFMALVQARPWCQYKEYLQQDELIDALARAHMLVLPTKEDNCPMAVLEAMAAGVPVAASRIGGIPDLVAHDETGLLFDPDNPREIAAAIEKLLQDSGLAATLGQAGRDKALEKYHPSVIAEQHVTAYKQLMGSHRP